MVLSGFIKQVEAFWQARSPFLPGVSSIQRWGVGAVALAGGVTPFLAVKPVQSEAFTPYCQQTSAAIAQKEKLRQEAVSGNREAQRKYKTLLGQHADRLKKCRSQTWPQNQAIWIRLYACDAKPGVL